MTQNNMDQDNENIPIKINNNTGNNDYKINSNDQPKNKYIKKKNIIVLLVIIIFIIIYIINNNRTIAELNIKIERLESQLKNLNNEVVKKKIGVAFVTPHIYGNGIGRLLTILTELLMKTGKFEVYLINEQTTQLDFKYHKKVKREIQKKEEQIIRDFDEANDIQIYILNNDVSDSIEIYQSLGKKVVGIFHGVYLSCVFTNNPLIYRSWYRFKFFDSFIHIIPDDYYVYKNFGFNNTIFIPNLYTFNPNNISSSKLEYKNVLMVARIDDSIKGGKYGILAMSQIVKIIPDAQLTIVAPNHPKDILDLINQLKLENNVHILGYTQNISQFYLNASVLLVTSVSESFPMVMNEGKAYGLPIVSFNIDYSPCFQNGVITVEMFDYKSMAIETVKLLNNYEYRKKMGEKAKLSLNMFNNNDTIKMWEELFISLLNGKEDYIKFQEKIEKKYYNETLAKNHLEKHYKYGQQFNEKHYKCHTFENFFKLDYINKIEDCFKQNNTL